MTGKTIAPTQPAERISEIDIVRGLALFGILMVNMSFFKYPIFFERYPSQYPAGIEQISAWFIQLFFTGNFYAVFSFLFGLGFFIFMERTVAKGLELVPLYRRRLFALLVFGFIHLFFIWSGDILFIYAVVGFILLRFRDKPVEAIRKWIIGLFAAALVLHGLLGLLNAAGEVMAGDKYAVIIAEMIDQAFIKYREAGFTELVAFRLVNEVPYVIFSLVVWIPAVLGFFLCGLYAGRLGIFKDIAAHELLLKKIRNTGLPLGALFLFLYFLIEAGILPLTVVLRIPLLGILNYAASLFLFPAYVSLFVLASRGGLFRRLLAPTAAAGRMALTNYLAQTLICILLFYGFGLGLYGEVSIAGGIIITVAIYLGQVLWSNLWLMKFRYGPMEWLWRFLTYKQVQPFLINDR